MKRVERSDLLDYQTYTDERLTWRPQVMAAKQVRRIHVGEYFTFLFENRTTIRYQVQEMMRVERIVRERDIQHELDTYNEVLGGDGELGATLLVEIADEASRAAKLVAWLGLNETIYARLADGTRIPATWDERQVGDDRLSSVQYLKFAVGDVAPVAIGVGLGAEADGPGGETELSEAQRAALQADLDDR